MEKLNRMQTFSLVIEEGSFAQAARRLGITKAAVSKRIIALENELNVKLINRSTRNLSLTEVGQLFYESLQKVFFAVSDAESVINHIHSKPRGLLRIASHRNFGEKFIIKNLKEWVSLYPDLKIDIELSDRFPNMEKEGFDLICGISHEGPEHLVRKKIASAQPILCASPLYLEKYGSPNSPNDLKKHRYITHSFRNSDKILSFSNHHDVQIDFFIRLNDAHAMLNCALDGLGIIKIFHYFIAEKIESGALIEILKAYREPPTPLYIFYQRQKFMPSKLRLFIDFLCQKVEENYNFFRYDGF